MNQSLLTQLQQYASTLMNDQQAIIRMSKLPAILGISIATIHRLRAAGEFVKPVRLGKQSIGFFRADIDAWMASRPVLQHFTESI
jgi:prophage regulatory protein